MQDVHDATEVVLSDRAINDVVGYRNRIRSVGVDKPYCSLDQISMNECVGHDMLKIYYSPYVTVFNS